MGTSALFPVIDALVDGFTVLLEGEAVVFDGPAFGDDPGNYVLVGVDDPDVPSGQAASFTQEVATMGRPRARTENGDVVCAVVCWRGDADTRACRADLQTLTARIEQWVRAAEFGGLPQIYDVGYGATGQLLTERGDRGAALTLVFHITYSARI